LRELVHLLSAVSFPETAAETYGTIRVKVDTRYEQ
jgi:hypothetical protein